jgi:hypothetical protein
MSAPIQSTIRSRNSAGSGMPHRLAHWSRIASASGPSNPIQRPSFAVSLVNVSLSKGSRAYLYGLPVENPWVHLPDKAPYVLDEDRPHVEAFNQHQSDPDYQLHDDLLPVPFMGNAKASLVVISLNPSLQPDSYELEAGGTPRAAALRKNLTGQSEVHVGLQAEFAGTGGSRWWRKAFRAVHERGHPYEDLAHRVFVIEFHGYRSAKFRSIPITLPSQHYSFHLLREAIRCDATIVVMRGLKLWEVAVPELSTHSGRVLLRNARSATISPRNLGDEGFESILKAVSA